MPSKKKSERFFKIFAVSLNFGQFFSLIFVNNFAFGPEVDHKVRKKTSFEN